MKRIITLIFGVFALASSFSLASAYYPYTYCSSGYGYNYTYGCQNTQRSYYFTQGCYTYYYDGNTLSTRVVSYNCNQQYVQPIQYYYNYTSPYYTYQYQGGAWYPDYGNYSWNGWNTGSSCYWQNGYQICY